MTATLQPKTLFALLRKYREMFRPYRLPLTLGVLMLLVTNLVGIAVPWLIKEAVESIQAIFGTDTARTALPSLWGDFHRVLWLIAGAALVILAARVASRQFLLGTGRRVEADFRNRLYQHLLTMPTGYYAAHPSGELMSRLTSDVDAIKYLTGGGVMMAVNTILAYALTIPMMLAVSWQLALATFLLYPVMIFLMSRISKKVRQGYYEVQDVLAGISTMTSENLNGMTVIQSYVREAQEQARFEAICDKYYGTYMKLIRERILLFMVLAGLSGISMLLMLLIGGNQVIGNQLSLGGFVAFTMYLEHLSWPTMALGWAISVFQQGTAALERVDEVLSTESTIQDAREVLSTESTIQDTGEVLGVDSTVGNPESQGRIEIRDLSFAYHNPYLKKEAGEAPDEKYALRHVSLNVQPGETIAIVGPVGSGKSTLLRLLPRLYDVPPGCIFLDGSDITTVRLEELRRYMVLMPQLSFLFSTTVSQNIAFGKPEVLGQPETGIIPVAEVAAVHGDIQNLPERYETLVGERGLMLSGGQRQRVALARAILMEAPVLILDDPFSNIDAESEHTIVQALQARKIFHDKTTLIATHRFSLVGLCDRIVLMDAGRILAAGTHAELFETQPLYRELHHLQELRETLGSWELDAEKAPVSALEEDVV